MAFADLTLPQRPMTPEDVLAFFVDVERSVAPAAEGDEQVALGFDTTIEQWRQACGLYSSLALRDSRWLHRLLAGWFDISATEAEWETVLKPEQTKLLGGLCELIASRATVAEIRPVTIFGRPCPAAGAFFAIRSMLAQAGIDVAGLRPSSPLGPLLREHCPEFSAVMAKLAPGKLPIVRATRNPWAKGFVWGTLLGVVMLTAFWLVALLGNTTALGLTAAAMAIILLSQLGAYCTSRWAPARVECGGLRNFRDVCYTVLEEKPRRP